MTREEKTKLLLKECKILQSMSHKKALNFIDSLSGADFDELVYAKLALKKNSNELIEK